MQRTVSFEGVREPPPEMLGLPVAPDMESAAAWEGLLLQEIEDRCGDLRNRGSGRPADVPVDVDGARVQKADEFPAQCTEDAETLLRLLDAAGSARSHAPVAFRTWP